MSKEPIRILLVDDDEDEYILTHDLLTEANTSVYDLDWVATYDAALAAVRTAQHDICLFDYHLGQRNGLELLCEAIAVGCKAPIIMLTGQGDRDVDVAAMQAGAADFLDKSQLNARLLERSIRYAIERKAAEEALRQERDFAEGLVETAQAIVLVLDREGRIVRFNPYLKELSGYSLEDVRGASWFDTFLPEQDRDRLRALFGRAIRGVPTRGNVNPIVAKDGCEREIEWYDKTLKDADGNVVGLLALGQDITERLRAETELREERASLARRVEERTSELSAANAELARAARLKDEFLASMSHELRTPLNAILGMCEVLESGIYGALDEKQRKATGTIDQSGRHLLSLITDILDVSKIEAGKMELEPTAVPVNTVCEASLQFVRQQALKRQVRVSFASDSRVTTLRADQRRLKQILVNLLSNAVKFTPAGGTIGLEVEGDAENQVVRFSVWDTGIGIAPEDMVRLFKPFVQLDSRLSRQYAGTGLGLALVYRLAEMHGGSVSVESEGVPGRGSRFTVSLPWRQAEASVPDSRLPDGNPRSPQPSAEAGRPADPRTAAPQPLVLLADDDQINVDTVYDYLSIKGYRIIVARNGVEAVRKAWEERPQVILMDIQMPEMDGLEATRRIRSSADRRVAGTPIVAFTALAMSGDRERCLEAGANEYLSKPVSLKQLVNVIEAATSGQL